VTASNQDERGPIDAVAAREAPFRVRCLERADRKQWQYLWRQYLPPAAASGRRAGFYLQPPPDEIVDVTFERLLDPDRQPHALIASKADRLVGFAHYLFHPSTWSQTQVCYLEDLYVDPDMRRAGVGRALMRALYAVADQANASAVYWLSQESNSVSRALFQTLAHRTDFIRYER
jgi:GNAT superfamily N-acetyltransferase